MSMQKNISGYKDYLLASKALEEAEDIKRNKAKTFPFRPKISIITPVYNTDEKWLRLAVESVINQVYDNWELCIADGGSTKPHVKEVLKEYGSRDNRIKIKYLSENKGIVGNSNEALSLATGELAGFLDHDDEIDPAALYEVVSLLNERQETDLIYTDEDKINTKGERSDPHFKPDWAPDTLRSYNYICHFAVIRRTIIQEVGGFREGFDGSQDYDLFLRVAERTKKIAHIQKVLYHWRSLESSAAGNISAKEYAFDSARKALKEHIGRLNLNGLVCDGLFLSSYRVKYRINGVPLVTIVIPTKDKADVLKKCVDSVLSKSSYENYEIMIVDNQSREDATFRYYREIGDNLRIKIITYDKPFNFSAINNYAASNIASGYIIFLNNDTEIISPDWIETMLEFAQRTDVGAVGSLMYFPDDTIQHAGVIVGIGGVAGHAHYLFQRSDIGYMGRAKIIQNLSAVTGACLMTKKIIFEEVGGFDEDYSHAFNDIDLCLKMRERGYLIVYTPYAELYHHESLSRGYEDAPEKQLRFAKEIRAFRGKWHDILEKGDPYYNPNLTLFSGDFSVKGLNEMSGNDMQVYNLYRAVFEKDTQIHGLNTSLWEKDAQIHGLNTSLWEKNAQIHGLNTSLWEKNAQIHGLETAQSGKDMQIYNLHNAISEKDKLIYMNRGMFMDKKDAIKGGISSVLNMAAVRILIISGIEGAPYRYRCLNLKEELYYIGHHQVTCKYVHEVIPSADAQEYDMVILNRAGKAPNIIELIDLCKKNGNIIVYSTDDLVTDHNIEAYLRLDKYLSVTELAYFHEGVDWAIDVIKGSDAVIVSTDYLRSQLLSFNKNVYVLENALNEKQLKKAERLMPEFIKKKSGRNEIILGYFSGWPHDHDYDFAVATEPILKVLGKYDNVKLRVVGYLELNERFKAFGDRVEQIDFVPFDIFQKFIADVDINLAPLEPNPHKRSKSAIKFLEAGALGVPTIASNLEPYNGVIRHLEDGLLCYDSQGWLTSLQLLIEDAPLRYKIGTSARHKVISEHTTVIRSNKLKTLVGCIIADSREKTGQPEEGCKIEGTASRQSLANRYIMGDGIEIGALHNPLEIDNGLAKIKYVDRKPVEVLKEHYPELKHEQILPPDIIGEAENLSALPDSSQDFIIANHLLEHSPNPIKALKEFHRVVKKYNGTIYLALPNNTHPDSFDKGREITTIEHMANDYFTKESERRVFDFVHYWEWATKAGKFSKFEDTINEARRVYDKDYAIHYHVFDDKSFLSLLSYIKENLNVKFDILEKYVDGYEFIFILKPAY